MNIPEPKPAKTFQEEHQGALRSIRVSRMLFPMIIGVGAVLYLLRKQFDPKEFSQIDWTFHTFSWLFLAVILTIARHISYAARLRVLTNGAFSWWKCIELIFIWEFSSAVSPTSVGGSAVAFFVLAQEKLSVARSTTIVMYTFMLDGFFFAVTLPILYLLFGSTIMRPGVADVADTGGWGVYFLIAYLSMAGYSLLFYYGIFVNPTQLRRLLGFLTKFGWLRRYHRAAIKLGSDIIIASKELKQQSIRFHLLAAFQTLIPWVLRFLLLNCIIIAFVPTIPVTLTTQFELYARLETMFLIFIFSPTPGGAGIIELLFNGFLHDYISNPTIATVISTIWRLITYYSYLFAGALIVPYWIRGVLNERRKAKLQKEAIS